MLTVADIMTCPVMQLHEGNTLHDAHYITRHRGIRHLPVVNQETQQIIGVVTQKSLIAKVMSLMVLYGSDVLEQHEKQTNIMEVAVCDFDTIKADETIQDVAPFFLRNKHGCLPVVDDNNHVIGIVTSTDFVNLSMMLIDKLDRLQG
ncbi:CBS domain-containing protein [Alteromonas lipolytica]|nr:CBS domain-containing protein [Alteromonas lipolytica]GGF75284.1 CBS domain-containing protein [Alteromonas lipolytica]